MFQTSTLDWERDGHDWPHREVTRFVNSGGRRWMVQSMGEGPVMLLVHGTGASSHSWRGLMPLLADSHHVVSLDLPGHGFTTRGLMRDLSLRGMARALAGLMEVLDIEPEYAVGHSAGAAILLQMRFDEAFAPRGIVSLNGAMEPFRGATGVVFPALARLLFLNPLAPRLFASRANPRSVARLIGETGSTIDETGIELYRRLLRSTDHVSSALGMMANWDLEPLLKQLPELDTPLLLVSCERDRTVPQASARRIAERTPAAQLELVPALGHLAHEEDPQLCADLLHTWISSRKPQTEPQ